MDLLAALVQAMGQPEFYPHPVKTPIQVIQTHISYIFLTGDFAYKVKKPMNFGFLDFTTLEQRHHFCQEELRLNQRGAADLYMAVLPITLINGQWQLGGDGDPVEYALQMRQFPQECLLTRYFEQQALTPALVAELGQVVAEFHAHTPTDAYVTSFGRVEQVRVAFDENYAQTVGYIGRAQTAEQFQQTQAFTDAFFATHSALFEQRMQQGKIRECHGDLHLGNICYWQNRFYLFDCIEFNEPFRLVDVMYDVAYGVMDLQLRQRPDLANLYLNTYLEYSGDWEGVHVLGIYLIRQSYVRAKVLSFLLDDAQASPTDKAQAATNASQYYRLAWSYTQPRQGSLILISGLSGSGKSTVARYMAQHHRDPFGAIHIRSDAVRKHLGGIPLHQKGDDSLYSEAMTQRTYDRLLALGTGLAQAGYTVILDAKYDRQRWREQVGQSGIPYRILHCSAPDEVIRQRLNQRQGDIADATAALITQQQRQWQDFSPTEWPLVTRLDTDQDWMTQLQNSTLLSPIT
ncbi:MAG: bifunctional aminoglycoside phosphotransferase/ATP-binding protein [Synechococcales cyanobacterium]